MTDRSIFIGFEPREADAFAVCRNSLRGTNIPIHAIILSDLVEEGLYWRDTQRRDGQLWDAISDAPMATQFAISRFLTPVLAKQMGYKGWALFCDCDFLFNADVNELFDQVDDRYAVMCVKHDYAVKDQVKMDNQLNPAYRRKNWSSLMMFNLDHPANDALDVDLVNTVPGRDLHAFCWLDDAMIGEIDRSWNYLAGVYPWTAEPKAVHFTMGVPSMPGYENSDYADGYWEELSAWARG